MVRSLWKRTLVTTLAWAGLAWAQSPLPTTPKPAAKPAPVDSTERVITVQEPGKAAQKCKITKTWKTPEGTTAYLCQALDTGEIMTIVESGPGTPAPGSSNSNTQARASRIFHWGRNRTPPEGTPMPPTEAVAQRPYQSTLTLTQSTVEPLSARPASPYLPLSMPQTRVDPKSPYAVVSQPAQKPAPVMQPAQKPAPVATPLVTPAVTPVVATMKPALTPVPTSAKSTTPTVGCEPCVDPVNTGKQQVIVEVDPTSRATLPPLIDWRKSWGKADDHKSIADVKVEEKKVIQKVATKTEVKGSDPLQNPEKYAKKVEPKVVEPKVVETKVVETKVVETKVVEPKVIENKVVETKPAPKLTMPKLNMPKMATVKEEKPRVPLGMASVVAAGEDGARNVQFVTRPISQGPDVARYPIPGALQPAGQQGMMAGMPTMQQYPGMAQMPATDPAMMNAFSRTPAPQGQVAENAFNRAGLPTRMPQHGTPMSPLNANAMMAGTPVPQGMTTMGGFPMASRGFQGTMPATPGLIQTLSATGETGRASVSDQGGKLLDSSAVQVWMVQMRESLFPSQREYAIRDLARVDWKSHPEVVDAMIHCAKEDPAATVRVACIQALVNMQVDTVAALTTIQSLKFDRDASVRGEADTAFRLLAPKSK